MVKEPDPSPGPVLEAELAWLQAVISARLHHYFDADPKIPWTPIPAPDLVQTTGPYADFVRHHEFQDPERLVLILALAPDLRPSALDLFRIRNKDLDAAYGDFGGTTPQRHAGFLPTFETALFLLANGELAQRIEALDFLEPEHPFVREHILDLAETPLANPEPVGSLPLRLSRDALFRLLRGREWLPRGGPEFPAHRIESPLEWADLVLPPATLHHLAEAIAWLKHHDRLHAETTLMKRVKPGYRCLFHGPPGTGKTLTASLLGKQAGRPVYRINLAHVVSKYIGETEKNLERVFHYAETRDWVLFFDEADSLFGRRTAVSTSNDRYANQGTSYLLQRVEDFPGLIILATNLRSNIDEAFGRRFQAIVYFPMPGVPERLVLWRHTLRALDHPLTDTDLEQLARDFEVSGAVITNAARYATLMSMERGDTQLTMADLRDGLKRELLKEGISHPTRTARANTSNP